MNSDDLLQFKDYSPNQSASAAGVGVSGSPAQIRVNSPTSTAATVGAANNSTRRTGMMWNDQQMGSVLYDLTDEIIQIEKSSSSSSSTRQGIDGQQQSIDIDNVSADPNSVASGNGGGLGASKGGGVSFLTLEYYQQFFNVDTFMVLERIINSMVPKRSTATTGNYLRTNIGLNPDLYGPFWITVTLIFSIAISGNVANYLQHANESYHWRYNFHLVSYAATCIFLYVNFVPTILWAIFRYSLKPIQEGYEIESSNYTPSLLSLICIYGYSLAIYIPVSILWVIQISFLQWLLVITAALLSGSVLIMVLTPALRNSKLSLFLIIGILTAHFLLAAGFMLFFFHVPSGTYAAEKAPSAAPLTGSIEPVHGSVFGPAEETASLVAKVAANIIQQPSQNLSSKDNSIPSLKPTS